MLLEDNYVHLPLKSAMHAVNPVQRLRLLRARLARQTDETMGPERVFHAELSAVFHSVRDLHTNYLLPAPFAGMIAYLPFQVERCVEDSTVKYIVTRLAAGVGAATFRVGVEITALERRADRAGGGGERRPLRRQQPRRSAVPRGPVADHPAVAPAPAAGRGVGDRHLSRRRRRAPRTAGAVAGRAERARRWPTPTPSPRRPPRWDWTCTPTRSAGRPRCCSRRGPSSCSWRGRGGCHHDAGRGGSGGAVDDADGLPGPQRGHRRGHVRPPADLHVQRARPRRLRGRVRPAAGAAAAGRPHPRCAGQRRRAHLRQRVHPADPYAAADHPGAGAVHLHAAEPGDLSGSTRPTRRGEIDLGPWFPSMEQAVQTGSIYSSGSRSPRRTAPTRSGSATSARSCW